jgi:hypothetical protein
LGFLLTLKRVLGLERELFDANPFDFGTNFFEEHTEEEIQAHVREHNEKFRRVERELNRLKKRINPKLRLQLLIKIRDEVWNNGYWNDEIAPYYCVLRGNNARPVTFDTAFAATNANLERLKSLNDE